MIENSIVAIIPVILVAALIVLIVGLMLAVAGDSRAARVEREYQQMLDEIADADPALRRN